MPDPVSHLVAPRSGLWLLALVGLAAARPLGAQSLLVGGQAGAVASRQVVERGEPSGDRTGFLAGAFVAVPTPSSWLEVLAEASYVQRGGRFSVTDGATGDVRADYLVFSVAPAFRHPLGPAAVYLYAGPSLEAHLQVRSAAELAGAYREPSDQIFSVQVGAGVEIRLADRWNVRVEARHVEGLSAAFDSEAGDFRHRSRELVVRVGRPRGR